MKRCDTGGKGGKGLSDVMAGRVGPDDDTKSSRYCAFYTRYGPTGVTTVRTKGGGGKLRELMVGLMEGRPGGFGKQ